MVIRANDSDKLESLYNRMSNAIEMEKREIATEGGRGGELLELLTNEAFLTALTIIVGHLTDAFKAYLVYKKDDGAEQKEPIDKDILKDPTTPQNQQKIEDMTKDKKDPELYIEFEE